MSKICIYPGTFDPITNGHLDVIRRALKLFDKVIVAIALNDEKRPYFDSQVRKTMVEASLRDLANTTDIDISKIQVLTFDGLLVNLAKRFNSNHIIRGLRAVSDFEYELQMCYANSSLSPDIETVYLMPSLRYAFISSSVVRSIFTHGGNISHLVSNEVSKIMYENKK